MLLTFNLSGPFWIISFIDQKVCRNPDSQQNIEEDMSTFVVSDISVDGLLEPVSPCFTLTKPLSDAYSYLNVLWR